MDTLHILTSYLSLGAIQLVNKKQLYTTKISVLLPRIYMQLLREGIRLKINI